MYSHSNTNQTLPINSDIMSVSVLGVDPKYLKNLSEPFVLVFAHKVVITVYYYFLFNCFALLCIIISCFTVLHFV